MSAHFYNEELYPLQDRVLELVQQSGVGLYLTGGTFLGRFLLQHRYSDDLDFFANHDDQFKANVQRVVEILKKQFPRTEIVVNDDAFLRMFVWQGDTQLKLDFVNDVRYRAGQVERLKNGVLVDNWMNVLSNKVTALERDAAKDYVDILFLSLRYAFNWEEILNHAKAKDSFVNEIQVSQRFMNFNITKLIEVIFPESFNPKTITHSCFETLAKESLHGFDNSLAGKSL